MIYKGQDGDVELIISLGQDDNDNSQQPEKVLEPTSVLEILHDVSLFISLDSPATTQWVAKEKQLISAIDAAEIDALLADGTITGGMIPKIEGCIEVVEAGVEAVVIIDGRVPHCVLLELFTEHDVGTLVGHKVKPTKKPT